MIHLVMFQNSTVPEISEKVLETSVYFIVQVFILMLKKKMNLPVAQLNQYKIINDMFCA